MTQVLQIGLRERKHPFATSARTSTRLQMLQFPHRTRALLACIAGACVTQIVACGGGDVHRLSTFQAASLALGQTGFDRAQSNQGSGPSASSLAGPMGMASTPDGGLLVADAGNNRVLFFSPSPHSSGTSAVGVLGQQDFQGFAPSTSQTGLSDPLSISVGAGKMAVADSDGNRVLIYDRVPAHGEPVPVPAVVVGQPHFGSRESSCSGSGLAGPSAATITPDGKLIIADTGNSRLLVWNRIPLAGVAVSAPDLVLGQSDTTHCGFADDDQDGAPDGGAVSFSVTGRVMSPADVWSDGKKLVVADGSFHRILIWNQFPTRNFQPADLVLGQPDFSGRHANAAASGQEQASPTARTVDSPRGVHSDGTNLAVADLVNNRVLVWTTFPQLSFQPADVVLGHAAFSTAVSNDANGDGHTDAPTSQVLSRPTRVLFSADALFVSDSRHNRVLRFRR